MSRVAQILNRLGQLRYLCSLFAFVLVAVTVAALRSLEIEPPTVVVLILPILASAYLGGLGPGLVATATAVAGAERFLMTAPATTSSHAVHLIALTVVGATLTGVIEALHRSRHHARQSHQDSLRSQTLFGHAFAGSPSAMSLSRVTDRVVVEVNQAYIETFELARDRIVGRTMDDAGLVLENADRKAGFDELQARGAVMVPELAIRLASGDVKTVALSAQLIEIDGECHALSTFVDLTERKRAEAAALATEAQFREATQKLESLGLLAGGIAHDFNNILAVIGANIGMLGETTRAPEDRELIDEVEGAVGRATSMTRQLLALSRNQVTEPIVLDLDDALTGKLRQVLDAA